MRQVTYSRKRVICSVRLLTQSAGLLRTAHAESSTIGRVGHNTRIGGSTRRGTVGVAAEKERFGVSIDSIRRTSLGRSWGTVLVAMASSAVLVFGILWGLTPFTAFQPTAAERPLGAGPACQSLGISGNAAWDQYSSIEYARATQATRDLGAGRVRIGANWGEIETSPGRHDWSALDDRVNKAREAGLAPLLVIQTVPSWIDIPVGPTSDAHLRIAEQFGTFSHAVAARYGRSVDSYEIWNEPNLPKFWPTPDVGHYMEFLKKAYPAIHRADPGATVITGGLAPAPDARGSIAPLTFIKRFYDLGGRNYSDAIGMHPYSYPEMPSGPSEWNAFRALNDVKRHMAGRGDSGKKIWITEYGAPTGGASGVKPEAQAAMIVEAYRLVVADPSLGPIFMYTLVDGGAPQWDSEYHFGLYYADLTPTPAVRALQDAVADCGSTDGPGQNPPTIPVKPAPSPGWGS